MDAFLSALNLIIIYSERKAEIDGNFLLGKINTISKFNNELKPKNVTAVFEN